MKKELRENLVCPTCKGQLEEKIGLWCKACNKGFNILDGIPNFLPEHLFSKFNVKQGGQDICEEYGFYENMYSNLKSLDDGHCVVYGYEELYNFMKDIPIGSLLDVGCGAGHHSKDLAEKGFDVTGVDISLKGLLQAEKISQTSGQDVGFVMGDIESLPFSNDSYDVVFCSLILHHFPNKIRILEELSRVCKRFLVAFEVNSYDPISFVRFNILNPTIGISNITKNQRTVSPKKLQEGLGRLGFKDFVFKFVDVHHFIGRYPESPKARALKIYSEILKIMPYKCRFNKFMMKCRKNS